MHCWYTLLPPHLPQLMTDNPLQFPSATFVGQNVPKKAFFNHALPQRANALREFLTHTFDSLTWLYKLHPTTLHLADGQHVHEIDVFRFSLKTDDYDLRLLAELDALIPRPTLFIIDRGARADLLMQHKLSPAPSGLSKAGSSTTPWERIEGVDFSLPTPPLQLSGLNLDAVYAHLLGQVSQLGTHSVADYLLATRLRQQCASLQQECDTLARQKQREPQYNRRLEWSQKLKAKMSSLNEIKEQLKQLKTNNL